MHDPALMPFSSRAGNGNNQAKAKSRVRRKFRQVKFP
jgi:hypothetical protein